MPQSNQKKEKDSFQNLSTISSHTAWDELLDTFLSLLYDDRIVADAGYRLSLYFPKEKSDFRYQYIIKRLSLNSALSIRVCKLSESNKCS